MGDFSIRCDISGVPIPCGTPVLVIEMGKSERQSAYRFPTGMPVAGKMGSYGEVETGVSYVEGGRYLHVLPELWQAAGTIWEKAMFKGKVPDLMAEITEARARHQETLREYAHFKGQEGYESLIELRLNERGEWFRRMAHVVLFAPDFGKTNALMAMVRTWTTRELPPTTEEVQALRTVIAAFMSTCITGTNLLGPDGTHPMEQYPDLACDLAWHTAIVTAIKNLRADRRKMQEV